MNPDDVLDRRFDRLADSFPAGVVVLDHDQRVIYANRRIEQVLGVPAAELTLRRLLSPFGHDDRQLLRLALDRALDHHADEELEVDVVVDGASRRCAVSIVSVSDDEAGTTALMCVSDVTRSARLRDDLRERATYDVLTGCHNRSSAMAALEMTLADASGGTGVLFIDLDQFKPVNDRLGHAVGDELLTAVARRLKEVCRASDIVGRLGGDEFLVVCRDLRNAPEEAMAIARRVQFALEHPFPLTDHTVSIGASIGVAFGRRGALAIELVSQADQAMYEAKRAGDGPVGGLPAQVTDQSVT